MEKKKKRYLGEGKRNKRDTNKQVEKIQLRRRIPFTELIRRLHKVKGHNHLDDLKRVGDPSHTIYNPPHRVSGHKPQGPTRN